MYPLYANHIEQYCQIKMKIVDVVNNIKEYC